MLKKLFKKKSLYMVTYTDNNEKYTIKLDKLALNNFIVNSYNCNIEIIKVVKL